MNNSKVVGVLFGKFLDHTKENPFPNEKSSKDYALFTNLAKQKELRVVISSIKKLKNKTLTEAHEYDGRWKKANDIELDVILDRSPMSPKTFDLKRGINKRIPMLNNPGLNKICWDKASYKKLFPEYVPATFLINNLEELKNVIDKIPSEKIVLKPRYGIMGNGVKIAKKDDLPEEIKPDTIVQEFIDASCGIKDLCVGCVHDIRVLLINNNIHHCYVRKAKNSLLSNIAQGGVVDQILNEKIPKSILKIVKIVSSKFAKYKYSLYTIDCVFDEENKPVLLELESIPVIGSAYKGPETKQIQKRFINDILDVLNQMVER